MAPNEGTTRHEAAAPRADRVIVDPAVGRSGAAMTVVPLVEAGRVAGFEVRCSCGDRIFVECVEGERCDTAD